MTVNENTARYLNGVYPLGLLLALAPIVDLGVRTFPVQFGSIQWRFGSFIIVVANLGIILTGMAIVGGIAAFNEHRTVLRIVAIVAGIGAVLAVLMGLFFLLDVIQLREMGQAATRAGLLRGSVSAVTTLLGATAAMVGIALGAWRAAKADPRGRAGSTANPRAPVMSGAATS